MKKPLLMMVAALAALLACDPWANETPTSEHYPLIGAHSVVSCEGCHPTDRIAPAPTACEACHADDEPPDHYEGSCANCHTPRGWDQFNHDFFPLEDSHALGCLECHDTDDYTTLEPECRFCHAEDEPEDHYGPVCETCHAPTTWFDFNHQSLFPIPHEGNGDCIDCHTTGDNRSFACIECHEHRQDNTDDEHQDVSNYTYASASCLGCHPQGTANE